MLVAGGEVSWMDARFCKVQLVVCLLFWAFCYVWQICQSLGTIYVGNSPLVSVSAVRVRLSYEAEL